MNNTEEGTVEASQSLDALEEMDLDSDSSWDLRNSHEASTDDYIESDGETELVGMVVSYGSRIDDSMEKTDMQTDSEETEGCLCAEKSNCSITSRDEKENLLFYAE